jgi:GNAT superfamily N-acetyltransferase
MIRVEKYLEDRDSLLPLFRLADDSDEQLLAYYGKGDLFVARADAVIVGHAQVTGTAEEGAFELKSIAVAPEWQGKGAGRLLVASIVGHCAAHGATKLIVSTATADIGNLRFYQRQGFRMERIVRDAFGPAQGYADGLSIDGIALKDQIFFSMDI